MSGHQKSSIPIDYKALLAWEYDERSESPDEGEAAWFRAPVAETRSDS